MSEGLSGPFGLGAAVSTTPLVTTIIPAYNHEQYVRLSLLSAINQTYKNLEIIIIDDGSSDRTASIIEETILGHSVGHEVRFIRQSNQGLSRTLNRALSIANGTLVQFLASDDAYLPDKTTYCVSALQQAGGQVAGVYSDGYLINDSGEKIGCFSDMYPRPMSRCTYRELLVANWIPAMGALYWKDAVTRVGGFDESLAVEDYDLLLRLTKRYKLHAIPEKLFLYRLHGNNTSKQREKMVEQFELLKRKCEDLSSYDEFKNSIRGGSASRTLQNITWLNLDLLRRSLVRRLQVRFGLRARSGLSP